MDASKSLRRVNTLEGRGVELLEHCSSSTDKKVLHNTIFGEFSRGSKRTIGALELQSSQSFTFVRNSSSCS